MHTSNSDLIVAKANLSDRLTALVDALWSEWSKAHPDPKRVWTLTHEIAVCAELETMLKRNGYKKVEQLSVYGVPYDDLVLLRR